MFFLFFFPSLFDRPADETHKFFSLRADSHGALGAFAFPWRKIFSFPAFVPLPTSPSEAPGPDRCWFVNVSLSLLPGRSFPLRARVPDAIHS